MEVPMLTRLGFRCLWVIGLVIPAFPSPAHSQAAKGDAGWKILFDGKSTENWRGYRSNSFPSRGWVIDNGCLKVQAGVGGGDIVTKQKYENFELELDWKVAPGGNSGVMYRVSEEAGAPYETGVEYQLLDDANHPDGQNAMTSAGSAYALYAPSQKVVKPAGEFNHSRILVNGNHVEHWLNGVRIVQYEFGSDDLKSKIAKSKFRDLPTFAKVRSGNIDLQDHGNDVWFCKIRIRELK